jgi:hypothetical protein
MRRTVITLLVLIACSWARTTPVAMAEELSLLKAIGPWQYPRSALANTEGADGMTIDAEGKRTVQSVVFKTVMTTEASVEEVLDYYKTKLAPAKGEEGKAEEGKAEPAETSGRSVFFSDDSDGRPFALHTVIVNAGDTSTTLVISRGKDEAKTHIAWKQYRRFSR